MPGVQALVLGRSLLGSACCSAGSLSSEATASALASSLRTPASYVGLLGSKRKTILIYESMLRRGFSLEDIRRTRSPIGIDVGARTPEEIAVSIMAEILMFRLGGSGGVLKLDERLIQAAVKRAEKPADAEQEPEAALRGGFERELGRASQPPMP